MTQEHILEYRHYTLPEFKGDGYWVLSHPSSCPLASCSMNKVLDGVPVVPGRYKVTPTRFKFEAVKD